VKNFAGRLANNALDLKTMLLDGSVRLNSPPGDPSSN
jgi:hypothetical protein